MRRLLPNCWRTVLTELWKLLRADVRNILRIRWLWLYMVFLGGGTYLFLYMSEDISKVVLSLLNVTLLIVPLVSAFFSITYLYDSRSFIEFMLSQPVGRKQVFMSKLLSVSFSISLLYLLGVLVPVSKYVLSPQGKLILTLVISGVALSVLFTSIAFLVGTVFDDKARG